ncbi:FxsB family cyclophane-forming radical SAM/SPASM peptide maturase [Pseudofrankia inefficax]|uniref:Radical SAM domain protein n=1 Tax=Pseudofrankia inefficax (strain DSM 45817 / CECT 9037 / DDB 130130 / EuI1c) TaxID=298654 RepID=E3JAY9_PSEI1|nr:FxsB family cyclophane-forming radical SAM/SPASM peptide maturase [Pseudofrankia inefficax]ADP84610.1 Radical SAM domain protein [Pseudofrankia inefficax]
MQIVPLTTSPPDHTDPAVAGPAQTPASPPEWPRDLLDVAALRERGWRARPFRQFILKIHSRCNLACDYCYVYSAADSGWRRQPPRMSRRTAEQAIRRIAEHTRTHGLSQVEIVLHGGEPLLAGADFVGWLADELRRQIPPPVRVRIVTQTNGVALRAGLLDLLVERDIAVCVSLDGPSGAHDRHRRFADGRRSYPRVREALELLTSAPYRRIFAGLLAVVDLDTDPLALYDEFLAWAPPAVDVLLPHGNWNTPPAGRTPNESTPYAEWLIPLFDRWYSAPRQETNIRLFAEIIQLVLGGASRLEAIGLSPVGLVVVETDGAVEQVDTLKSAYDRAAATGLDIFNHSFDDALGLTSIIARQIGAEALCESCQACSVGRICGGGYYPHRYRVGSGFRNPSVYCPDLFRLVRHIEARVRADLTGLRRAPQC